MVWTNFLRPTKYLIELDVQGQGLQSHSSIKNLFYDPKNYLLHNEQLIVIMSFFILHINFVKYKLLAVDSY